MPTERSLSTLHYPLSTGGEAAPLSTGRRLCRCLAPALLLPAFFHAPAQAQDPAAAQAPAWVRLYEPQAADAAMPYRLMRPAGFDPAKRYPVIVSLHGGGGRGADNRKQLRAWNKLLADPQRRAAYPAYVLAPQSTRLWDAKHLTSIKAVIAALPAVDSNRIYLLGHSMGGHGTYILLQIDPGYFAAAAPSAGTGRTADAEFIDPALIRNVPIWAFHGDNDKVCPYDRAQKLFAEMQRLGGNMRLTTWTGDGHGVSAKLIAGGENGAVQCSSGPCDPQSAMLRWLFAQSLDKRE